MYHLMAFRWRADDGSTLNADLVALCFFQGIRIRIAKQPYNFVIIQWVGSGLPAPPIGPTHRLLFL